MTVRFLTGKEVYLRPLEATDLERLHRWLNDARVRRFIGVNRPLDMRNEEAWFAGLDRSLQPSHMWFAVCLHEGDRHVGNTGFASIDWAARRAETATLVEPEHWGRGVGTESKRLLLAYAFDDLGLHRVESRVFAHNERSARHLVANGFVEEGRRRAAVWKDGRWNDELLFGILEEEWRARPKA